MVELSLLERLKLLYSLVFSSPLFLVLLFSLVVIFIHTTIISKKNKTIKIIYLIVSLSVIIGLLHNYYSVVLNILDTIAKNIVTIIYFPSVLEYIVMLIISLGILVISMVSSKTNKRVKTINLVVFSINSFIFFLILDQISKESIDLSNKISIYSNENLMALFELSIIIFFIWIIGLSIYKIIKRLTNNSKVVEVTKEDNNFYDEPELPKTIEELRKEELTPPPQIEYVIVEKKNDNDMFTLEEYRALKKILETIKNNEKDGK